ncbi:hypothetical protein, partial [Allosalinactinospora lopnorensis]|uniref:hypothetical protein n=1 Tax=Allosalinactinospora lopnorensis TaxID=1352348 RepID=UPI000623F13B
MSAVNRARWQAAVLVITPVALLLSFIYHPYLPGTPPDSAALAAAVAANPTRWGLAHIAVVGVAALVILAFLAIRAYLRDAGDDRWSLWAFPLIVVSAALMAFQPGLEFAPLAAAETGGDVQAMQETLMPWLIFSHVARSVLFLLGSVGFAVGIVRSRVLNPGMARVVVAALVISAVALAILSFSAFYVGSVAAIVALWPLAYAVLGHPRPHAAGLRPAAPTA